MRAYSVGCVFAIYVGVAMLFGCSGQAVTADSSPDASAGGTAGVGGSGGSQQEAGTGATGGSAGTGVTGGNGGSAGATSNPAWFACDGPGQCVLTEPGCCGTCHEPDPGFFKAVNKKYLAEFRKYACTEPEKCLCDESWPRQEPLTVACRDGYCSEVYTPSDPMAACEHDSDCVLLSEACCGICVEDAHLVAINRASMKDYCDMNATCAKCHDTDKDGLDDKAAMSNAGVVCGAQGHCTVALALCPNKAPTGTVKCPADQEGTVCAYGDEARPSCRDRFTCHKETWTPEKKPSYCQDPIPPIGTGACKDAKEGEKCSSEGQLCGADGDFCYCSACGQAGPCTNVPYWHCAKPPQDAACPETPPQENAPCGKEGTTCRYGQCNAPTGAVRECVHGLWKAQMFPCPK